MQRLAPGADLTFESTLFSNVNAAIPRAVLERYPFRDDLTMSEDQEWSRRVLRDGHALVYEPLAAVRHSHAYTVRSAFRRFFDSGVSAEHSYVEGDESRAALRRAGAAVRARGARLALAYGPQALDPVHGGLRAREVRRPPARPAAPPPAAVARTQAGQLRHGMSGEHVLVDVAAPPRAARDDEHAVTNLRHRGRELLAPRDVVHVDLE